MSETERHGAKARKTKPVGQVQNTDRLIKFLRDRIRKSRKPLKALGHLHQKSWEKILSGRQTWIRVETLMNKISPALGIDPETMGWEIEAALEQISEGAPSTTGSSTAEINPKEQILPGKGSPKKSSLVQLTWVMLPKLRKSKKLRDQLSDDDKMLAIAQFSLWTEEYVVRPFDPSWDGFTKLRSSFRSVISDGEIDDAVEQGMYFFVHQQKTKQDFERRLEFLWMQLEEDGELRKAVKDRLFLTKHGLQGTHKLHVAPNQ